MYYICICFKRIFFKHKSQVTTCYIIKTINIPWKLHMNIISKVLASCTLNCYSNYSCSKMIAGVGFHFLSYILLDCVNLS